MRTRGNAGAAACRLKSAAASSSAVSVLEAVPDQADLRVTLLRPADEEDTPDLKYVPVKDVADGTGARVVAVSGTTTTALYVPTPRPRVAIDETGSTIAHLPRPRRTVAGRRRTRAPGDLVTWWTG